MLGSVAHTFLNQRQFVAYLYIVMRIAATEHLTEHRDVGNLWVSDFHLSEQVEYPVFVGFKQFIIFVEVLSLREYRCPFSELHLIAITQETGVGTMHFLLYYIFQVSGHLCHDHLHELSVEGVLYGAVLLKF